MGILYKKYLTGSCVYGCKLCGTHLALWDDIMSKDFRGRYGDAYLFKTVVNVNFSPAEDREMKTGLYTVRDITCKVCAALLGWTYVKAHVDVERYKEGKFILEVKKFLIIE